MRTGKSRKMREQGGGRRKMIAQERERQENMAEGEAKMIAQERERQENKAE